jgi:hypothetical protein
VVTPSRNITKEPDQTVIAMAAQISPTKMFRDMFGIYFPSMLVGK